MCHSDHTLASVPVGADRATEHADEDCHPCTHEHAHPDRNPLAVLLLAGGLLLLGVWGWWWETMDDADRWGW